MKKYGSKDYKGGNVHCGTYAKPNNGGGSITSGNGRHGPPKGVIDDHRKTTGIPRIKGHHFNGPLNRGTGRSFK